MRLPRITPVLVAVLVACGHPAVDHRASEAPSPAADPVRIARIIDAERWVLRIGDRVERVRLIGVDARFAPAVGCSPSGEPLADLVGDAPLRIEQDSRAEDPKGRSWVWLWSGDQLINAALLRAGIATLGRYWPNQRNETALLRAQLSAARDKRGLWGGCAAVRWMIATDGSRRRCDPSYPGPCVPPFRM